jgi:hypothetical protein
VTSASWRWTWSGTAPPQTRRAASSDHAAASSCAAAIAAAGGQISLGGPVPRARRPNPLRLAGVAWRAREGDGGGGEEASPARARRGLSWSWGSFGGEGRGGGVLFRNGTRHHANDSVSNEILPKFLRFKSPCAVFLQSVSVEKNNRVISWAMDIFLLVKRELRKILHFQSGQSKDARE